MILNNMSSNIDFIKIQRAGTIKNLIQVIRKSGKLSCALVYNGDLFVNIVTDGDIRRALLAGCHEGDGIDLVLDIKRKSSRPEAVVASVNATREIIDSLFKDYSLRQLVIVDDAGNPISIIDHCSIGCEHSYINKPFVAVVMAGGFGTRLRPLTIDVPKPMLPINGRPLLDILVGKLVDYGAKEIYITTHYLPEKIISHFGDGGHFGVSIKYIHEEKPLGTAGALSLIPKHEYNSLVINGDVLTELDFGLFHAEHMRTGSDMTIAGTQYNIQIPFGVITENNGFVKALEEKPEMSFLVNSGIYFVSPCVWDILPEPMTAFTMPQLAERLIDRKRKVSCFAIYEQWLDIGRPDDYNAAKLIY